MGSFLVRSDINEVRKTMLRQLEFQDFEIVKDIYSPSCTIYAIKESEFPWEKIEVNIQLTSHEKTTLVDAKFQMGLAFRILLLIPITYFTVITFLMMLYVEEFLQALGNFISYTCAFFLALPLNPSLTFVKFPKCYLILIATVGLVFFALMAMMRLYKYSGRSLSEDSTEFWGFLKKNFSVRLLAFNKPRSISASFIAFCTGLLTVGMEIFLFRLKPVLSLWALPLLLWSSMSSLIPLLYEHRPSLYPKAVVVRTITTITFFKSLILLLLLFCLMITVAYNARQKLERDGRKVSFSNFKQYIAGNGPFLDEVGSGLERMRQLRTDARLVVDNITEIAPQMNEYRKYAEGVILLIVPIAIALVLYCLFYMATFFGKQVMTFPLLWGNYTGRNQVEWIRIPAEIESENAEGVFFKVCVILLFITGAILNVFVLLISIDVTWFVLTDQLLIFSEVRTLLTWVFVPFYSVGSLTSTEEIWIWDGLSRLIILTFVLSPLLVMGRRIIKVCSGFVRYISISMSGMFRSHPLSGKLIACINDICQNYRIESPRVIKTRSKAVHLGVLPSLVNSKSIVLVSAGAISQLTEAELMAAVAHELGHIKRGIGKIRILQILSALGGFPAWFLLMLVDVRKLEEDADKFVLQVDTSPEVLASAIIKTVNTEGQNHHPMFSVMTWFGRYLPKQVTETFLRLFKPVAVIERFYISDDLIGYSHPLPRDRIAAILASA